MKKIFCFVVCCMMTYYIYGQNSNKTLSDAEKIVGLSKCWSETKYNFAYFDKLSFDWDSLYKATIPVVLATKNDFEYFRELQRFIATLKDGHSRVSWSWERGDLWNNWATIPLQTRLIEGKMIVASVLNDTLQQMGIKKGLEIIRINDINTHEYISEKIKPYINSSTNQWMNLRAYGREATRGKKSEEIRLTFKDEKNNIFSRSISRSMSEKNLFSSSLFNLKEIEDNIGILKIRSFFGNNYIEQFDSIYKRIEHLDALIIDIRDNGGGNSSNSRYILSHLTSKTFKMSDWSTPIYNPAHASWNYPKEWYLQKSADNIPVPNKTIYSKPVALLINEGTFSAAEDFCVGFRNMERGPIIGSPSGGSTGNPINFSLPGGGQLLICTKKDTYPDGTEFVGKGIIPDIEVNETISSFLSSLHSDVDNSLATRKAVEILKNAIEENK